MFHLISKHLKFHQKYSATCHIFNSLLSVGNETLPLMFKIYYTNLIMESEGKQIGTDLH